MGLDGKIMGGAGAGTLTPRPLDCHVSDVSCISYMSDRDGLSIAFVSSPCLQLFM